MSWSAAIVRVYLLGMAVGLADAQDITPATTADTLRLFKLAASPAVAMPIWTIHRDVPPSYGRNSSVWTGPSVDLTGKAAWNSCTGSYGTTAISPSHVVYADHVNGLYPPGTVVRFVTNANTVVERSVVQSYRVGASDVDLSRLDAALPDSIHWYKVMPEHWFLRCSRRAPGVPGGLPCIVLDGNSASVLAKDLVGFARYYFSAADPVDPRRRSFTRELRLGDSGSPMFLLVGNELVLDGIFGTKDGGTQLSSLLPQLDSAMADSAWRVSVADFSKLERYEQVTNPASQASP
jgi:hypothetical protein